MLTYPSWPNSNLTPISFSFKPNGSCGFSIINWHCLDIPVLRIKCSCKAVWELNVSSSCDGVRDVSGILRKMPVLDVLHLGILTVKIAPDPGLRSTGLMHCHYLNTGSCTKVEIKPNKQKKKHLVPDNDILH